MAQTVCSGPVAGTNVGGFTLSQLTLCQGSSVRVTAEAIGLSQTTYDFMYPGAGIPRGSSAKQFTYARSGIFTVVQQGYRGRTGTTSCQDVTVLTTEPVMFSLSQCQNRTVSLLPLPDVRPVGYDQLLLDWGDGRVELVNATAPSITHTYLQDGRYTIFVTGRHSQLPNCPATRTGQAIQVNQTTNRVRPAFSRVESRAGGAVTLAVAGPVGDAFTLWQAAAGQPLQPGSLTLSGGQVADVPGMGSESTCFQLRATDACGLTAESDVVCSLALSVQAADQHNLVSWQPYRGLAPFQRWSLSRNDQPVVLVGATAPGLNQADDGNGITCGQTYCYSLSMVAGSTQFRSVSVCVVGQNTTPPPAPDPVRVSVLSPNLVSLQPTVAGVPSGSSSTWTAERAGADQSSFQSLPVGLAQPPFQDSTGDFVARSVCYVVARENGCGLVSPSSSPACTIWLSNGASAMALQWTTTSPFGSEQVRTYVVQQYDQATGRLVQEVDVGLTGQYAPDVDAILSGSYWYRVVAISESFAESYSNPFRFAVTAHLFIPDAFSPNGDQVNDSFEVKGTGAKTYRIIIYDRWGNGVFSSTEQQISWDGSVGGQAAPSDHYTYLIELTNPAGQLQSYRGSVLLLR